MPFLPSMQALLSASRRRDQADAMAEVRRASEARQEAYARARLRPHPAPIETSVRNAPAPLESAGGSTQGDTP